MTKLINTKTLQGNGDRSLWRVKWQEKVEGPVKTKGTSMEDGNFKPTVITCYYELKTPWHPELSSKKERSTSLKG